MPLHSSLRDSSKFRAGVLLPAREPARGLQGYIGPPCHIPITPLVGLFFAKNIEIKKPLCIGISITLKRSGQVLA